MGETTLRSGMLAFPNLTQARPDRSLRSFGLGCPG